MKKNFPLHAPGKASARVVDAIIGVFAGLASLITLGKIGSINNLAHRALQFPGLVKDLFYCGTKFINPWTGVLERAEEPRDQ